MMTVGERHGVAFLDSSASVNLSMQKLHEDFVSWCELQWNISSSVVDLLESSTLSLAAWMPLTLLHVQQNENKSFLTP